MNFLTGAQIYGDMILFPNSFYFNPAKRKVGAL